MWSLRYLGKGQVTCATRNERWLSINIVEQNHDRFLTSKMHGIFLHLWLEMVKNSCKNTWKHDECFFRKVVLERPNEGWIMMRMGAKELVMVDSLSILWLCEG
jgi:hypothetical protein